MDERINWSPDYDFAILSMMQQFTDKELENLGIKFQDIAKYHAYEKRDIVKTTVWTENDHNQVSEN